MTTDPELVDVGRESYGTAIELQAVLEGRNTAANYVAIAMVLGQQARMAARPDFNATMRIVRRIARKEFDR